VDRNSEKPKTAASVYMSIWSGCVGVRRKIIFDKKWIKSVNCERKRKETENGKASGKKMQMEEGEDKETGKMR